MFNMIMYYDYDCNMIMIMYNMGMFSIQCMGRL